MSKTPRIALTIGDPAGIGPELVAKLLADTKVAKQAEIRLIASRAALQAGAKAAGTGVPKESTALRFVDWPGIDAAPFAPAVAAAENGRFMLDALRVGTQLVSSGEADALCFAPLNKGALRLAGMQEEDEMRWFAQLLGHRGLCGEFNVVGSIWTSRVTSHVPLKDVAGLLTPEGVADAIQMITEALRAAGHKRPRVAVCGFNPHNGDNGNYGREEIDVIGPGIRLAGKRGCAADGPFPADTIFLRARDGAYDGIVTMYHDQGQIATKLLGFDIGVTVQGGLPIPITTPAQGTAYDIAGKGRAKPVAMINAFVLACQMGRSRRAGRQ